MTHKMKVQHPLIQIKSPPSPNYILLVIRYLHFDKFSEYETFDLVSESM